MPQQKDLKRVVRTRMQKPGESYTAARVQVLRKKSEPAPDYAALSGVSDSAIEKATGRSWIEWVKILDAFGAAVYYELRQPSLELLDERITVE